MKKPSETRVLTARDLPSVDRLMSGERMREATHRYPRKLVVEVARQALSELRLRAKSGALDQADLDRLPGRVAEMAANAARPSLRPVINGTGVILHTGLGRAVLPESAVRALLDIARGHCNLEIDLGTGRRGSRLSHVEALIRELTGAEAAMIVNNNAAATFLAVNTHARGREVIVSRGQLVEIGGEFRLPEIIEKAGARLREVGTTNRTRISDYETAVSTIPGIIPMYAAEDIGAILRVHPSNFRIVGFTEEASLDELVELAHCCGLPMIDDIGSGALVDTAGLGLSDEPMVQASVKAGADLVIFSGDKLLGGPQAGFLIGKEEAVSECARNSIARVVRVDKLTLAAVEATLRIYKYADDIFQEIPTLRAIAQPISAVKRRAAGLAARIRKAAGSALEVAVVAGQSEIGGGSLPGQQLDTALVSLRSSLLSADDLGGHFRRNRIPVIGRVADARFLLDARTILDAEVAEIARCAGELAGQDGR